MRGASGARIVWSRRPPSSVIRSGSGARPRIAGPGTAVHDRELHQRGPPPASTAGPRQRDKETDAPNGVKYQPELVSTINRTPSGIRYAVLSSITRNTTNSSVHPTGQYSKECPQVEGMRCTGSGLTTMSFLGDVHVFASQGLDERPCVLAGGNGGAPPARSAPTTESARTRQIAACGRRINVENGLTTNQ